MVNALSNFTGTCFHDEAPRPSARAARDSRVVGAIGPDGAIGFGSVPAEFRQHGDAASAPVSFNVYHNLIQAIVSALEARDPHTAEHSLRVGDMVERTCLLMNLPARERDAIHMAAHMHDIGKIGIPDAVLLKRSRLTPEEHAILRDHARIGAEIIASCPGLEDIATIVRHHHERWDGTGYPDGLAGEDIPFGSRIVAVCDSIDAMLGKRRAKKSLTQRECVQEIFANMGTMYDPDVAWFVLKRWDAIVGPVNFTDSCDFEADGAASRTLHCAVPDGLGRTALGA